MPGDTVYSILKRYGFNDNQRKAALRHNLLPKDFILAPGDIYKVIKNSQTGKTELRFFSKKEDVAYSFWKRGSKDAGAESLELDLEARIVKASGRVRGSLVESISRAVGDDVLAYRFMDAFLLDYNLPRILRRNAPFSITYEKLFHNGQFVRFGEVLRAEIEIEGKMIARTFKSLKKGGIFFNPEDDYEDRPFYAPVDYIRISSLFQPRRFHPIRKLRRAHEGVDFELPEGEPVYSIGSGVVLRSGKNRAAGRFVVIRHSGGYESYYNHMSSLVSFRPGQSIKAGALVGRIGCSGYCTKPHLHFAIKKHGRYINPVKKIRGYSYDQRHDIRRLMAQN